MKFAILSNLSESPPPVGLAHGDLDAAHGTVPLASMGGLFHAGATIFELLDRLRRIAGAAQRVGSKESA